MIDSLGDVGAVNLQVRYEQGGTARLFVSFGVSRQGGASMGWADSHDCPMCTLRRVGQERSMLINSIER